MHFQLYLSRLRAEGKTQTCQFSAVAKPAVFGAPTRNKTSEFTV